MNHRHAVLVALALGLMISFLLVGRARSAELAPARVPAPAWVEVVPG